MVSVSTALNSGCRGHLEVSGISAHAAEFPLLHHLLNNREECLADENTEFLDELYHNSDIERHLIIELKSSMKLKIHQNCTLKKNLTYFEMEKIYF